MIWHLIKTVMISYSLVSLVVYIIHLLLNRPNKSIGKKNVCLITAHPDDECMFFGPIMRQMVKNSNNIFVLCMTNGNYDGQGPARAKELESSCAHLIDSNLSNVTLINETELPDSPKATWNKELCISIIQKYIKDNKIDIVITFDAHGISSHPNHCFLYTAMKSLPCDQNIQVFYLKTINVFRKYSFLFDIIPSLLDGSTHLAVSSPFDYIVSYRSMLEHKSQLVWFRYLYIVFSRYMLINCLRKS